VHNWWSRSPINEWKFGQVLTIFKMLGLGQSWFQISAQFFLSNFNMFFPQFCLNFLKPKLNHCDVESWKGHQFQDTHGSWKCHISRIVRINLIKNMTLNRCEFKETSSASVTKWFLTDCLHAYKLGFYSLLLVCHDDIYRKCHGCLLLWFTFGLTDCLVKFSMLYYYEFQKSKLFKRPNSILKKSYGDSFNPEYAKFPS